MAFNTSFQIAHGIIAVAYNLHRWGIIANPFCHFCTNCPESIEHLFVHCTLNHLAKHWMLNLVFKSLDYAITSKDITFGPEIPTDNNNRMIFLLISEYRLAVWTTRNQAIFENRRQKARDSLTLLKNRIQLRLQADYIRLGQMIFERQWIETGIARKERNVVLLNY